MKQIFKLRETNRSVREKYRLNLNVPNYNQVTFCKKSLRIFGPKIWNSLPYPIKSSKNLESFKTVVKNWGGVNCKIGWQTSLPKSSQIVHMLTYFQHRI